MRVIPSACAAVLVAVMAGFGPGTAVAQPVGVGPDGTWTGYGRRGTPVQALPTPYSHGGSCVQWCIADASPCDPDYYKVADRRCNFNQNGIFAK